MRRNHWDAIWKERDPTEVTWYQPEPRHSIDRIKSVASASEPIIDVGAGSSSVVDGLLDAGYTDLTALDISGAALAVSQRRLGARAEQVEWITADVLTYPFERRYAVWHDRAVFHFLVDPAERTRYVERLDAALMPGGSLILATFGPRGPEMCSGLPVRRYGASEMVEALNSRYTLQSYEEVEHTTPAGASQQFAFGVFRARADRTES